MVNWYQHLLVKLELQETVKNILFTILNSLGANKDLSTSIIQPPKEEVNYNNMTS